MKIYQHSPANNNSRSRKFKPNQTWGIRYTAEPYYIALLRKGMEANNATH